MSLTFLDYGRPNPFGETIGKPKLLAWPVNVYRVTLPKGPENAERTNPFERVIAKLIEAGVRGEEALTQETCLPRALVHCVLLRLQDQGYVDAFCQIINRRSNQSAMNYQSTQEFVTACVFRELATGKILPHIHFMKDNPLKRKEDAERYCQRIPWQETHRNNTPKALDVINALRGMHKRCMAFGSECRLPSVQLITVAEDAELYYLDCPIAIQKSDGEFRIADPFGNGFSLVLENAFSYLLEKDETLRDWLMHWKTSLCDRPQDSATVSQLEPYDTDPNRARYPNLIANLRVGRHRQFRSIEQIHAVIEWALFYSCAQRSFASAVKQLKLTIQSEQPLLLQRAAEDLALEWPACGIFPVSVGKLADFLAGKAELGTVLSLSLLMAVGDPSHPLRRIASAHKDLIVRLQRIKRERDKSAHGTERSRSKDVEHFDEPFMREIVSALLPTIRFSNGPASVVNQDAISDARMNARTSIQTEFGFALYNRLGTDLQERLVVAEQFWLSCNDGDNSLAFCCDLYAALQAAFRRSLSGVLPPDMQDSEFVSTARKNANACGLGDLPECLITAKPRAIRETLLGNDQTLQACVVTFLLVSPWDSLRAVAQTHPSFISDVARVIEARGHGNEPLLLSKDEIRGLRKAAYTTLKTLLEA